MSISRDLPEEFPVQAPACRIAGIMEIGAERRAIAGMRARWNALASTRYWSRLNECGELLGNPPRLTVGLPLIKGASTLRAVISMGMECNRRVLEDKVSQLASKRSSWASAYTTGVRPISSRLTMARISGCCHFVSSFRYSEDPRRPCCCPLKAAKVNECLC